MKSFQLDGHTFWFRLQENELSSVLSQTVPLEGTHRELSTGWSHLWVSSDSLTDKGQADLSVQRRS